MRYTFVRTSNVDRFLSSIGAVEERGPRNTKAARQRGLLFARRRPGGFRKVAHGRDPNIALQLQQQMIGYEMSLFAEETRRLEAVNATMRSEYASGDAYVRRWRPTFGYAVALSWILQTAGIVGGFGYAILFQPASADRIINAISTVTGALTAQWGVALTVLGVSVTQRSKDKQLAAGVPTQPGIVDGIVQRITGGTRGR